MRSSKYEEIEIDGIKVDYYDTKNKVIHEIKKSNKVKKAHEWQLKYYMFVFEQHGVDGVTGILEYPTLRKTEQVLLTDVDRDIIKDMLTDIEGVIMNEECPPLQKRGICKNCSYYDFCFINESEE
jgi:CRISPR-associated exonuclease Cas4